MPSPNEITVNQLSRLIGTPSAPVVIDVRIDEDFAADLELIPTARRSPHDAVEQLEAGMLLYDAFYRCARDARDETHDWPQAGAGG